MERWCEERRVTVGAIADVGQVWELGRLWYEGRLARAWKRRTAKEMEQIFEETGLTGAFWKLG